MLAEARVLPRTLAGATVLQIVPSLRDHGTARTTVDIARALVQGRRARDRAPAKAGRWSTISNRSAANGCHLRRATFNPMQAAAQRRPRWNRFVTEQRVDIVHAKNAGAAWSALVATDRSAIGLVTDLPDLPPARMRLASFYLGALSRGDRVIAHSHVQREADDRALHAFRSSASASFRAASTSPPSIRARCSPNAWPRCVRRGAFHRGVRIVLVPGRVAPWNGQMTLVETARLLVDDGMRGVTFVLAGDDQRHKRYARSIMTQAQPKGVAALFRMVGHSAGHGVGLCYGRCRGRAMHRAADSTAVSLPRRRRWHVR